LSTPRENFGEQICRVRIAGLSSRIIAAARGLAQFAKALESR